MKKRNLKAACAALGAPVALAWMLVGLDAQATPRERLLHAPPLPWPLELVAAPPAPPSTTAPPARSRPLPAAPSASAAAAAPALDGCCAALQGRSESASRSADARTAYGAAASACSALAGSTKAREAASRIEAQLRGAELPHECK